MALPVDRVAQDAEVVVVTVPQGRVPDLPAGVLDHAADGAVVVDTGNDYPQQRDGRIAEIEDGLIESEWVSARLGLPVAKAFMSRWSAWSEALAAASAERTPEWRA